MKGSDLWRLPCSEVPALCDPGLQPSSPAPPAASAGWPGLQPPWPAETEGERGQVTFSLCGSHTCMIIILT